MAKAQPIEGLDCNAPARDGIRLILDTRLAEMISFRDAALDFSSEDGVHDMRVASRRLRSLLKDFKPFLRTKPLKECSALVKEVANALGDVRDEDVAIKELKKIEEESPAGVRPSIESLIAGRAVSREVARERLMRAIEDRRLADLQSRFDRLLNKALREKGNKQDRFPLPALNAIATLIIRDRLIELEELSVGLYQAHDPEGPHYMRIAAKRLRYSLELFAACFGEGLADFAKQIADIQGALGDMHDCDVWAESISSRLTSQNPGDAETRSADIWLLGHFARERAKHYNSALEHWAAVEQQLESGVDFVFAPAVA
jgi:CHAD domain-containing protein